MFATIEQIKKYLDQQKQHAAESAEERSRILDEQRKYAIQKDRINRIENMRKFEFYISEIKRFRGLISKSVDEEEIIRLVNIKRNIVEIFKKEFGNIEEKMEELNIQHFSKTLTPKRAKVVTMLFNEEHPEKFKSFYKNKSGEIKEFENGAATALFQIMQKYVEDRDVENIVKTYKRIKNVCTNQYGYTNMPNYLESANINEEKLFKNNISEIKKVIEAVNSCGDVNKMIKYPGIQCFDEYGVESVYSAKILIKSNPLALCNIDPNDTDGVVQIYRNFAKRDSYEKTDCVKVIWNEGRIIDAIPNTPAFQNAATWIMSMKDVIQVALDKEKLYWVNDPYSKQKDKEEEEAARRKYCASSACSDETYDEMSYVDFNGNKLSINIEENRDVMENAHILLQRLQRIFSPDAGYSMVLLASTFNQKITRDEAETMLKLKKGNLYKRETLSKDLRAELAAYEGTENILYRMLKVLNEHPAEDLTAEAADVADKINYKLSSKDSILINMFEDEKKISHAEYIIKKFGRFTADAVNAILEPDPSATIGFDDGKYYSFGACEYIENISEEEFVERYMENHEFTPQKYFTIILNKINSERIALIENGADEKTIRRNPIIPEKIRKEAAIALSEICTEQFVKEGIEPYEALFEYELCNENIEVNTAMAIVNRYIMTKGEDHFSKVECIYYKHTEKIAKEKYKQLQNKISENKTANLFEEIIDKAQQFDTAELVRDEYNRGNKSVKTDVESLRRDIGLGENGEDYEF